MYHSHIDFQKISDAIIQSIEAVKQENSAAGNGLQQLEMAHDELQQALSFSLSQRK